MASNFINNIIGMKSSIADLAKTIEASKRSLTDMQERGDSSGAAEELGLHIEEEKARLARLQSKLEKATQLLLNKDQASFRALQAAQKDRASQLGLQMRALKYRIMTKVTEHRMVSEKVERTAMRAKHRGLLCRLFKYGVGAYSSSLFPHR